MQRCLLVFSSESMRHAPSCARVFVHVESCFVRMRICPTIPFLSQSLSLSLLLFAFFPANIATKEEESVGAQLNAACEVGVDETKFSISILPTLPLSLTWRVVHRWMQRVKWERMIVEKMARELRDSYLFGSKTLAEQEALRLKTEELFNKSTSLQGR